MFAHKTSLENEKDAFVAHFRRESGHLVFSVSPGGEGRVVSKEEAVDFVTEFLLLGHRHKRRFRHSLWVSIMLAILFAALGARYGYAPPIFAALALLSLFGWWFTAIVQHIIRARFKYRVWQAVGRHTPVRALTRDEKIARGYAVSVPQWFVIGSAVLVNVALGAPPSALPPEWRDMQQQALAVVIVGTLLTLLGYGAVRLVRRFRARG